MIQVPADIHGAYTSFIKQKGVQPGLSRHYVKWLRYYLDFCHKYNFQHTSQDSMAAFIEKLKEKKQAENLRDQAHYAISIYYEMEQCSGGKNQNGISIGNVAQAGRTSLETSFSNTKENQLNQVISTYAGGQPGSAGKPISCNNVRLKQSGADWSRVFSELKNAIMMRHYSPKTLKTYSGWTRKFQAYTKSKDPGLVSVEDVKAFLTWMAVEKGFSASSQNQAFNALLFLFRNVFKKEFGKVDGIVRAKRKPYSQECYH